MKKYGAIAGGAVVLMVLVLSVGAWGVNQVAEAGDGGAPLSPAPVVSTMVSSKTDLGDSGDIAIAATKTSYFFPQDGPTTATVLILFNASNQPVQGIVTVEDDATFTDITLDFGPGGIFFISSDKVVSQTGWTWIDFGTKTYLGSLQLPSSVVVEGYIVWNGASDTYDPGAAVPRLPLRFLDRP